MRRLATIRACGLVAGVGGIVFLVYDARMRLVVLLLEILF